MNGLSPDTSSNQNPRLEAARFEKKARKEEDSTSSGCAFFVWARKYTRAAVAEMPDKAKQLPQIQWVQGRM